MSEITALADVTNGAENTIAFQQPFIIEIEIKGIAPLLLHAWNVEAVDAKAKAKKGSVEKKTDDLESYVYRDFGGYICMPTEYLRGSIINAAKFKQDPRSPRKSAQDLHKAAIVGMQPIVRIYNHTGNPCKDWDYIDKRRVTIQRAGVTRARPAFLEGWTAKFQLMCNIPELITETDLNETTTMAGKLIGVGDFRPSYGRFVVTQFKKIKY